MTTLEFINLRYCELSTPQRNDLYKLRKSTFNDRLGWSVSISGEFEFDDWDNQNTTYLIGQQDGKLICGVRFTPADENQMLAGPFRAFFSHPLIIGDNILEASRLFIDKTRVQALSKNFPSISQLLFLSMTNFGLDQRLHGFSAVVSRGMYRIFKNSGWHFDVLEAGSSEKGEVVYLIFLRVNTLSRQAISQKITMEPKYTSYRGLLEKWPLSISHPASIKQAGVAVKEQAELAATRYSC
ncbi:acyl-homoserine-lactone synthase [Halotalea alkalilenta]|uniref:acyl-homoserine-lactone synthase n=1 Tax=Halotalea alkalilenta TaxID=376489 RepID=UPI00138E276F|nr:acyl-homoserine-lactone synthase [Halotalea alkalilenta]